MAWTPKPLSWGPYDTWKGRARGLAITLVAAGFMTYAQAFGSGAMRLPVRFGYWLGLMIVGWFWGAIVSQFFFGRILRPRHLWRRVIASSLVIAVPYSVVVGVATALLKGSHFRTIADMADLVVQVTLVSAVMVVINVLVARMGPVTEASAQPAKFLDRLPPKLRGAEVWAVEAEDHYLRLHTSKGQDLILMRLSDALDELEGIEGAQVHRSWWVARDAITEAGARRRSRDAGR